MLCDTAREWLLDDWLGLLDAAQRAALRAHIDECPFCRAEQEGLAAAYATLARAVPAIAAPITASPAFMGRVAASLDAVDADRLAPGRPPFPVRTHLRASLIRRWSVTVALAATIIATLVGTGGLRHAWAGLHQHFTFLPSFGVGQVESTALVSAAPASASNGTLTLTVDDLVAGLRVTLLAYHLEGRALVGSGAPVIADALEAALIDARGRRYAPTWVLPATRSWAHGVPVVGGLLAFQPLSRDARYVHLDALRLPLAPLGRPWSVPLHLIPATTGPYTSFPMRAADSHAGIRLALIDLTRAHSATVVDLLATIERGPYRGARVTSLDPDAATGDLAPILEAGGTGNLAPHAPSLPLPVRRLALGVPEFLFDPLAPGARDVWLRVPAVAVALQISRDLTVDADRTLRVPLGAAGSVTLRAVLVAPPAGLGLDDLPRLRIRIGFPPRTAGAALDRVTLVAGGVSHTLTRDDPEVDLPPAAGSHAMQIRLESPVVHIHGPWILPVHPPAASS